MAAAAAAARAPPPPPPRAALITLLSRPRLLPLLRMACLRPTPRDQGPRRGGARRRRPPYDRGRARVATIVGPPVQRVAARAMALLLLLPAISAEMAATGLPSLSITSFGGKANGATNNQPAIMKAMAACEKAGGCTLTFPAVTSSSGSPQTSQPAAGASSPPYHPYGPPVTTVYRTSAINLTSHLTLVVPEGVQLRGTEDFSENCGGNRTTTCDDMDSPSWPVLPWPAYPSHPNRGGDAIPSKQAFIRGYNLTDVTLTGGGEIHAGGGWWWCVRMAAAVPPQPGGTHAPKWCPAMVKEGKIPGLSLVPPRMLHMIGCESITLDNLTFSNSPYWTL
jgi:polygalacturonase